MEDLFQALPKLLRAAGESEEVLEAASFAAWRRVAGEALRGCAVPFRLFNKRLIVSVPDTIWRKQLEQVSPQLVFRLNSLLGQALITYVEFRVDPQTVREERARLGRRSHYERLAQEDDALRRAEELDDAASAIHDETLRHRFLLAAGSCMNRTKQ